MIWSFVASAAPWAIPPLLGAVIGYATNSVAIRMLFRPLRRWRLLGIPVPLTPGVIPRRRGELAESIGRMVSRELLTEEVFRARLESESVRRSLRDGLVTLVDRAAEATPGQLARAVPLRTLVFGAIDLIVPALCREREQIVAALARRVAPLLDELGEPLARIVSEAQPLGALDSDALQRVVVDRWPAISGTVAETLRSPAVRRLVAARARSVLRYALDQLSDLQRLFVTVGQYERTIEARLPQIVDRALAEAIAGVQSTETRDLATARLVAWIDANRTRTVAELLGDSAGPLIENAVRGLLARWSSPQEMERLLAPLAERACDGMAPWLRARFEEEFQRYADRPFGEMLPLLRTRRASIGRALAQPAQRGLVAATTTFVQRLDVYSVVVDRINGLEVERVEALLLGIIRRHLHWINLFGALLGALIGGVQIVLRLLSLA